MDIDVAKHGTTMVVRSIDIAKHFGKRHDNVMRDIERLIREEKSHPSKDRGELFFETSFTNDRNREYREYLLSRDGFTLLAMGFTGSQAFAWKLKYLDAFNGMEKALLEREKSVMQALNESIALLETDKEIASHHAKALATWKRIRKQHIETVTAAHEKAQLILKF